MREQGHHVSKSLNHGGREPDGEVFMVEHFAHLVLGLEHHEDRIEKLTPENIPELSRELTAVLDEGIEKIVESTVETVRSL